MKPVRLKLPLSLLALIAASSCSGPAPDDRSVAQGIGESGGNVPASVKLAAAQMLLKCHVPVQGRYVYVQFERASDEAAYTLELTREQSENAEVRRCLIAERNALGMDRTLDLGEAPPAPGH